MTRLRWIHLLAAATAIAAPIVWWSTGAEGYTRWPNERLAAADAPPAPGERELLGEIGFLEPDGESATPDIQSRFALGLVPGGFDPRHLVSVVTLVGAAVSVSLGAAFLARRRRAEPAGRSSSS